MPWLEEQGIGGGAGWNAKTAGKPNVAEELVKVREAMNVCNERIWRKLLRTRMDAGESIVAVAGEVLEVTVRRMCLEEKVTRIWQRNEGRWSECVHEEMLWKWKRVLDGLVVCPIDKHNVEAIAVCPEMYGKALQRAQTDMKLQRVPEEKRRWVAKYYGKMGSALKHQPYGAYRKRGHQFGCLRLWFKFKNMKVKKEERRWEDLAWRPLVSFQKHRYRRAFSMLSRL